LSPLQLTFNGGGSGASVSSDAIVAVVNVRQAGGQGKAQDDFYHLTYDFLFIWLTSCGGGGAATAGSIVSMTGEQFVAAAMAS
jgi:hypothetical protein